MTRMPTGEEAPRGFQQLYDDAKAVPPVGEVRIDCVTVSQLSSGELLELEKMQERAKDYVVELTGREVSRETFEDWMNFTLGDTTISDKLVVRAFEGKYLTGFAQINCGVFASDEWTILILMLDPSFRLQGIGSKMVAFIERIARDSGVVAINYTAIPLRSSTPSFWESEGYTDIIDRIEWTVGDIPREVLIYRKEL